MAKKFLGKVRWVNEKTMEIAVDIAGCTITFRLDGENAVYTTCEPRKPSGGYFKSAQALAREVLLDHQQRIKNRSA